MNRMPAIAIALVSSAVFATFVLEQPASHRVFAAAQAQAPQAQAQQGQSSKPTNGLVITLNGKPLTPDELLQLQASGLELEVKALQTQLKTDEDSIHALQTSL